MDNNNFIKFYLVALFFLVSTCNFASATFIPATCNGHSGIDCIDKAIIDGRTNTVSFIIESNLGYNSLVLLNESAFVGSSKCKNIKKLEVKSLKQNGIVESYIFDNKQISTFTLNNQEKKNLIYYCQEEFELGRLKAEFRLYYINIETNLTHQANFFISGINEDSNNIFKIISYFIKSNDALLFEILVFIVLFAGIIIFYKLFKKISVLSLFIFMTIFFLFVYFHIVPEGNFSLLFILMPAFAFFSFFNYNLFPKNIILQFLIYILEGLFIIIVLFLYSLILSKIILLVLKKLCPNLNIETRIIAPIAEFFQKTNKNNINTNNNKK